MFASSARTVFSVLALFACLFQLAMGAAVALPTEDKRDVWVPPVTYPHAGTVWNKGEKHNVTWSTANAPANISNGAMIMLRKGDSSTPLVLAQGFDLRTGRTVVTVPWVLQGSDYSVVLFGDSGNFSPSFTINGGPEF